MERRIEQIRKAVCATHHQAVIRSAMFMVQATVRQIQTIQQDISHCERIEQLTNRIRISRYSILFRAPVTL